MRLVYAYRECPPDEVVLRAICFSLASWKDTEGCPHETLYNYDGDTEECFDQLSGMNDTSPWTTFCSTQTIHWWFESGAWRQWRWISKSQWVYVDDSDASDDNYSDEELFEISTEISVECSSRDSGDVHPGTGAVDSNQEVRNPKIRRWSRLEPSCTHADCLFHFPQLKKNAHASKSPSHTHTESK